MDFRPYRSHKIRACDLCRKQKSRCIVDIPGQACQRCRSRGDNCLHVSSNNHRSSRPADRPLISRSQVSRPSPLNPSSAGASESNVQSPQTQLFSRILPPPASRTDQSLNQTSPGQVSIVTSSSLEENTNSRRPVHILGPSGAFDSQFLEQHLVPDPKSHAGEELIGIYSNDKRKPVGFASLLQSQEKAILDPASSSINRRKIVEQILGPFAAVLLELYLGKSHAAFPIADKTAILTSNSNNEALRSRLSDALVCEIYTSSLIYWKSSDALSNFPYPDIQFLHSLATGSLQDDFASPRLSTIAACLIHLNKRPVMSVIDNSMNVGRVVALAHSLGLNRDPASWKIPQHVKFLRTRLWWGVLIHDTWSAFARGIPAHIISTQYDVPILAVDNILEVSGGNAQEVAAAQGFILLCELTLITREMMIITYNLASITTNEVIRKLRGHEVSLDRWEDLFLEWRRNNKSSNLGHIPGESSLTLEFLTAKMLLRRIALHKSSIAEELQPLESRQYNQMNCRKSAHDIVQFTVSLEKPNFEDFWLPYAASHLTVCITLLLRCALETEDHSVAKQCMEDVRRFQEALKTARDEYDWELGETCIAHCEALVSRIKDVGMGGGDHNDDGASRPDLEMENGQLENDSFDNHFWGNPAPMDEVSWDNMISQVEFNEFFQSFMAEGDQTHTSNNLLSL